MSDKVLQNNLFTSPMLSIIFVLFYWSIIYLDSSQPGVNPPTPFSAISKQRFVMIKGNHINILLIFWLISSFQSPQSTQSTFPFELHNWCTNWRTFIYFNLLQIVWLMTSTTLTNLNSVQKWNNRRTSLMNYPSREL